jgi:hypothetical protein
VTVGEGVGSGDGVLVGAAVEEGAGVGAIDDVGDGVGAIEGVGSTVGVGVGVGVGSGITANSPASVACRRYPPRPVPLLSRCPSGPVAVTTSPVPTPAPARAASDTTRRNGPLPSSIVIPSPSASWLGAAATVPETASLEPSNGSLASPVVAARGAGSELRPSMETPSAGAARTLRLK